ncbi:MAG: hypothetical protein IPM64_06025 [Phycisphaerales bacterium]|nr:hypothetical protein [Phycisphaerales bacterium]
MHPAHPVGSTYSPANNDERWRYVYDYMGRHVEKHHEQYVVSGGSGSWVTQARTRSLYDGWNMIAELKVESSGDPTFLRKYTWGLDVSGLNGNAGVAGLHGAGGIGGLLACHDVSMSTAQTHAYCYDGNGNVGQTVDITIPGGSYSSTPTLTATYEYDPYGNRVNTPGGGELDQPFRFSTKYFDVQTAMYYYGYRYYLPGIGRWGNYDPLDLHDPPSVTSPTQGRAVSAKIDALGPNLLRYGAFRNSPAVVKDPLGLEDCQQCGVDVTSQVDALLLDVSLQLNRLPWGVAHDLCNYGMWNPASGWDIHDFYQLGKCKPAYVSLFANRCCGTGSYIGTVTYRGKCIWAVYLNYLLWGKMHRLCNARFQNDYMCEWQFGGMDSNGEWAVWVHRNTTAHASGGPRCGPPDSAGRVAATRAGFSGDPDQLLTHPSCAPCSAQLNGPLYGQVGGNTIVHDPTGGAESAPRRDSGRRPRW